MKSFLFSLDMLKKMNLKDKKKAILCSAGDGPIFGQGYDLCIRDKCHEDKPKDQNYANFPESYNSKEKYKMKDPKIWTEFCGAPKGCSFKIL